MSLSEDLSRPSVRAKEAEDRVAAAKTEAREKLKQARSNARTDAQQTAEQLQAKSSAAADKMTSYGEGLGQSWKEQLANVPQRAEERKARHEANKAEDDAEMAEEYAAWSIDCAYSAILEAEYASVRGRRTLVPGTGWHLGEGPATPRQGRAGRRCPCPSVATP